MSRKAKIQTQILEALQGKKALNKEVLYQNMDVGSANDKYALNRSLKGLKEGGLIEEMETTRSSFLRLTSDGRQKLRNAKLSSPTSLVDTRWDGFWRMVIIDLPESRKKRTRFDSLYFKKAGFLCMKNSVWISPFPFEHLFMNIKADLGLHDEIMIVVTKHIDPTTEKELFKSFGFE